MDEHAMRTAIERKRDGGTLEARTWHEIVAAYAQGAIDDAQMAALAMAVHFRELDLDEIVALTDAMLESGERLLFPRVPFVVDKHSSGGVSDIVSLVAVPIVAACGVPVAKLSGRALGHTGGTIDKLEAIPGFRVALETREFIAQVERVGCAIAAASDALAPADKRLYRLRDRTGSVPSVGLIVASILSKKLAGGAHGFVFDVKCGSAAFMHDESEALLLARRLVEVAARFDRPAHAIVSAMSEPLGRCIGTGIETIEAREFLRGTREDPRVKALVLAIAAKMLALGGVEDGERGAAAALADGRAYERFVAMVEAQGATRAALEALAIAPRAHEMRATHAGTVARIDAVALGNAARRLTERASTAGIELAVNIGERVERGQPIATIYGDAVAAHEIQHAVEIVEAPSVPLPLVLATL
uniref:Pyrimidine-nucleoside phosphorylase n=1 Tax=mine drainage metagenome TaxID=410659 RepID=E6Q741_9ZZZZ